MDNTCTKCGYRDVDGTEFCASCGAPLSGSTVCSQCGYSGNPESAAFCVRCGATLSEKMMAGKARRLGWWLPVSLACLVVMSALAAGVMLSQESVDVRDWWQSAAITVDELFRALFCSLGIGEDLMTPVRTDALHAEKPTVVATERPPVDTPDPSRVVEMPRSTLPALLATKKSPPPIATPTVTIPRVTESPSPTSALASTACSHSVADVFSVFWDQQRSVLGCAIEPPRYQVWMAVEPFQRGQMLWRQDDGRIYVLYNQGTWTSYTDLWREGDPTYSCGTEASPPTPIRGFGKIWCSYPVVRDGLGEATAIEEGQYGTIQGYFGGQLLLLESGDIYLLSDDDTWSRH